MTAPVPLAERLAEVLAGHDDPPGWMWSDSDQMVYACECGGHYVAGPIDVIQEHDVLAAAAWHRDHIADALADLLAAERQRGREEALREAAVTDCGLTYSHDPHVWRTQRGKAKACDGANDKRSDRPTDPADERTADE